MFSLVFFHLSRRGRRFHLRLVRPNRVLQRGFFQIQTFKQRLRRRCTPTEFCIPIGGLGPRNVHHVTFETQGLPEAL